MTELARLDGKETAAVAEQLVAVYRAAMSAPPFFETEVETGWFAQELAGEVDEAGFRCWLATDDDQVVGFAYGYDTPSVPSEGWYGSLRQAVGPDGAERWLVGQFAVVWLAVHPRWRGRGLGRRLLERLLAEATTERAWLITHDLATPARGLYRSLGFQELGHGPLGWHDADRLVLGVELGSGDSRGDGPQRLALLARAWDEAAEEYERYFVPRFAPWLETAVAAVADVRLPPGPILVPCCGTFPELPALLAGHPERELVGIDLSPGMVRLARERAARWPQVRVVEGDAATLDPRWSNACAGVVSVFGLQQLPAPEVALGHWAAALRPGGRLSVMSWPVVVEEDGPFALLDRVLAGHRPAADDSWQARLGEAVAADAIIERDEYRSFPMRHPDAETFWSAVTSGGPLRGLANARGEAYMRTVRQEFLRLAPAGPWVHQPRARWIVARR